MSWCFVIILLCTVFNVHGQLLGTGLRPVTADDVSAISYVPSELTIQDFQLPRGYSLIALDEDQRYYTNLVQMDVSVLDPQFPVVTLFDNIVSTGDGETGNLPDGRWGPDIPPIIGVTSNETYGIFVVQSNGNFFFWGAPKRYAEVYTDPPVFESRTDVEFASFTGSGLVIVRYANNTVEIIGAVNPLSPSGPIIPPSNEINNNVIGTTTSYDSAIFGRTTREIWNFGGRQLSDFNWRQSELYESDPNNVADPSDQEKANALYSRITKVCEFRYGGNIYLQTDGSAKWNGWSSYAIDESNPDCNGLLDGGPDDVTRSMGFGDFYFCSDVIGFLNYVWTPGTNGTIVDCIDDNLYKGDVIATIANGTLNVLPYQIERIDGNDWRNRFTQLPIRPGNYFFIADDLYLEDPAQVIYLIRPGTYYLRYRNPEEWGQPPSVSIIDNLSGLSFDYYVRTRWNLCYVTPQGLAYFMGRNVDEYGDIDLTTGQFVFQPNPNTNRPRYVSQVRAQENLYIFTFTDDTFELRGQEATRQTSSRAQLLYEEGVLDPSFLYETEESIIAVVYPRMIVDTARLAGPGEPCGPRFTDEECTLGADGISTCNFIECVEGYQCDKARGLICYERDRLPGEVCDSAFDLAERCPFGKNCAKTLSLLEPNLETCDGLFLSIIARVTINNDAEPCNIISPDNLLYESCDPETHTCIVGNRRCVLKSSNFSNVIPVPEDGFCNVNSQLEQACIYPKVCRGGTCQTTPPRRNGQEADPLFDYCEPGIALNTFRRVCQVPDPSDGGAPTVSVSLLILCFVMIAPLTIATCYCSFLEDKKMYEYEKRDISVSKPKYKFSI